MSDLSDAMKRVLADTFIMYTKSLGFHWNVEGSDFYQYHKFLEFIYEQLGDAIDPIAEHIRTLGVYAPASLTRFKELATIEDETHILAPEQMFVRLRDDNAKVLISLDNAHAAAEKEKNFGMVNFIEERLDAHEKLKWMLTATLTN